MSDEDLEAVKSQLEYLEQAQIRRTDCTSVEWRGSGEWLRFRAPGGMEVFEPGEAFMFENDYYVIRKLEMERPTPRVPGSNLVEWTVTADRVERR